MRPTAYVTLFFLALAAACSKSVPADPLQSCFVDNDCPAGAICDWDNTCWTPYGDAGLAHRPGGGPQPTDAGITVQDAGVAPAWRLLYSDPNGVTLEWTPALGSTATEVIEGGDITTRTYSVNGTTTTDLPIAPGNLRTYQLEAIGSDFQGRSPVVSLGSGLAAPGASWVNGRIELEIDGGCVQDLFWRRTNGGPEVSIALDGCTDDDVSAANSYSYRYATVSGLIEYGSASVEVAPQ